MKTVEELENKINDVENTLSGLKNELEELKKNNNSFELTPKTWTPNVDEAFWIANIELKPAVYNNIEQFKSRNNRIFKYNRIFKTLEECQLYCDIQRAFRDASRDFDLQKCNFTLRYDCEDKKIFIAEYTFVRTADLYFDSEETIQNLIDKFGEENVKRYYLGVY